MAKGIETTNVRAILTVDARARNRDKSQPCAADLSWMAPDGFPICPGDVFQCTDHAADGWVRMEYKPAPQAPAARSAAHRVDRKSPSQDLYEVEGWKQLSANVTMPLADWAAMLAAWERETPAQAGNHRELVDNVLEGVGRADQELSPPPKPDEGKALALQAAHAVENLECRTVDWLGRICRALVGNCDPDRDHTLLSELEDLIRRLRADDGD